MGVAAAAPAKTDRGWVPELVQRVKVLMAAMMLDMTVAHQVPAVAEEVQVVPEAPYQILQQVVLEVSVHHPV
jgi:hypothetical protein